MITKQQWLKAQQEELKLDAVSDFQSGYAHFLNVYTNYFKYLNIERDLKRKSILEIGPANFPALHFCHNYDTSYIIEPMESKHLHNCIDGKDIFLFDIPAEEVQFPEVDEIWLLNVLQHVMDPDAILYKACAAAKVIRFFEPINQPVEGQHLHSFTKAYFENKFMQPVKTFAAGQEITGFHTEECAYGVINLSK